MTATTVGSENDTVSSSNKIVIMRSGESILLSGDEKSAFSFRRWGCLCRFEAFAMSYKQGHCAK